MSDRLLDTYMTEARFLRRQLQEARHAKVADLSEVRKYRRMSSEFRAMFDDFMVKRTLELLKANRNKEALRIKVRTDLSVVHNDSPSVRNPKGICSPVKTDDIWRFETLVKEVFGNHAEQCTTAWPNKVVEGN